MGDLDVSHMIYNHLGNSNINSDGISESECQILSDIEISGEVKGTKL